MSCENNISITILAGGKSSRMGEDKGLVLLKGKPMIEYVITTAQKISSLIFISTNNSDYKKFGFPLISDEFKAIGPIGGIYSALKFSTTPKNLILTCDSPLIDESLLKLIVKKCNKETDLTYFVDDENDYPLTAIFDKRILPILEQQISRKEYRVKSLFNMISTKTIKIPKSYKLKNVNTKKDIEEIKFKLNEN